MKNIPILALWLGIIAACVIYYCIVYWFVKSPRKIVAKIIRKRRKYIAHKRGLQKPVYNLFYPIEML